MNKGEAKVGMRVRILKKGKHFRYVVGTIKRLYAHNPNLPQQVGVLRDGTSHVRKQWCDKLEPLNEQDDRVLQRRGEQVKPGDHPSGSGQSDADVLRPAGQVDPQVPEGGQSQETPPKETRPFMKNWSFGKTPGFEVEE